MSGSRIVPLEAFSVPREDMAKFLGEIPDAAIKAICDTAIGMGHEKAILASITRGSVPQGFESFFQDLFVVPHLVDVETVAVGDETPEEAGLATCSNYHMVAADLIDNPGFFDNTFLGATQKTPPEEPGYAPSPVMGVSPYSDDRGNPRYLYRSNIPSEARYPRDHPAAASEPEFTVPVFPIVRGGRSGWASPVGDDHVVAGDHAFDTAVAANNYMVEGTSRGQHGVKFYRRRPGEQVCWFSREPPTPDEVLSTPHSTVRHSALRELVTDSRPKNDPPDIRARVRRHLPDN